MIAEGYTGVIVPRDSVSVATDDINGNYSHHRMRDDVWDWLIEHAGDPMGQPCGWAVDGIFEKDAMGWQRIRAYHYQFRDAKAAMLFKLTWGGV